MELEGEKANNAEQLDETHVDEDETYESDEEDNVNYSHVALNAAEIVERKRKRSEEEDEDEEENDDVMENGDEEKGGEEKDDYKRDDDERDDDERDDDEGDDDERDDNQRDDDEKDDDERDDDDRDDDDRDDDEKDDNDKDDDEKDDDEKEEVDDEDEDEDDEKDRRESARNTTLYDFDIMMAKKKEENSKKRRRRNYDIINDNDDIIAEIINQMKDAVEADSEANKKKTAATKKLKLLPYVINQLRKVDLRDAFLDSDVLSVITEWLAPLPDRSLPHLNIRENLLKILIDFNLYDVDRIKASGIGKAIMYLYKHPKETRENKQRAKQLISCWSRPIFQLDSSFNSISKEEREQRDLELMKKQRRASRQDSPEGERAGPSSGAKRKEEGAQKPGDKGWIPRARVPAPSMRDYVIRPQSKADGDIGKNSRRPANMVEKYMKNQQERRRASKQQRAINMKIDRV